jgi:hypothetical protein
LKLISKPNDNNRITNPIKPDMVKRQVKEWEEKSLLNRKPDWEKNIIPTMKKLGFELSWAKKGLFVKQFKED